MTDQVANQYVSQLQIEGPDKGSYLIKDKLTLEYVQSLRQEMGTWQNQLMSLLSQLKTLENKVESKEGTEIVVPDSISKDEVEEIAKDTAEKVIGNYENLNKAIAQVTSIISQAEGAYNNFSKAEEKAAEAQAYAQRAMQSAEASQQSSSEALQGVTPILADYVNMTADISRCMNILIDEYDSLNRVKTKTEATMESLIDGQETTIDLIRKSSESNSKATQEMIAQYASMANTDDSPLTNVLQRVSSKVTQTATSWGAQVSSFSYQEAGKDEDTQKKIDDSISSYETALQQEEEAYRQLSSSAVAYNYAKQWYAYGNSAYESAKTTYDELDAIYKDTSSNLDTIQGEVNDAAQKLLNCVNKIKALNGSKDSYRKELQEAVQVLVKVYGKSVEDTTEALEVVNAKTEAIENVTDELDVNYQTISILLQDYGDKLSKYVAMSNKGQTAKTALDNAEKIKEEASNSITKAEDAMKVASEKYDEAMELLKTTADAVDKAANGLVVSQTAASIVRKGEVLNYVSTLKQSTVEYKKSLSSKYAEFVDAVRTYHNYDDNFGCITFWFYSVAPEKCENEEFINGIAENSAAYSHYYYNTKENIAYYWNKEWIQINSSDSNAAENLLNILKIAQDYSDIDDDNYRHLYIYNSGYLNNDTYMSPRDYSLLKSEESSKVKTIDNGWPSNYDVGDIWYSAINDSPAAIESVTPHYLTYPLGSGIATTAKNSEDKKSVGNWVNSLDDIVFSGTIDGNTVSAPFLWYYCSVKYKGVDVAVNSLPSVIYCNKGNELESITPYLLTSDAANSSITVDTKTWDWKDITTIKDFSSISYGEGTPYIYSFLSVKEKDGDTINSPVIFLDQYFYSNGIFCAELESSEYNAAHWVDCWVSQSRQISGGLNKVWDYINSSIAVTESQILGTVQHLAQLENNTYTYNYAGVDTQEDSVSIFANSRAGKAQAFTCETEATTQDKVAKNEMHGNTMFSPWESTYSQTAVRRIRVFDPNKQPIFAGQITLEKAASLVGTETIDGVTYKVVTYKPTDSWIAFDSSIVNPEEEAIYSEKDGYTIVDSNYIISESENSIDKRLVNTTITVKFAYMNDVAYPTLALKSPDGTKTILPGIPICAYSEKLNNYSSEEKTDANGETTYSNKAYNWENDAVVSLTLSIPNGLAADITWWDDYENNPTAAKYRISNSGSGLVEKFDTSVQKWISTGCYVYWEICDSSGLKKSSNLKVALDDITAEVKDLNKGLTRLAIKPEGLQLNVNNSQYVSDRNRLYLPNCNTANSPTNSDNKALYDLLLSGFEWKQARDLRSNTVSKTYYVDENYNEVDEASSSVKYYAEEYPTQVKYYETSLNKDGTITVSDILFKNVDIAENIAAGIINAPIEASSPFWVLAAKNSGTSTITGYNGHIVILEPGGKYDISCYVKGTGSVEFLVGGFPGYTLSNIRNINDTNGKSDLALKEYWTSGEATDKIVSYDNTKEWTYCHAVFDFDTISYGCTVVNGGTVITGAPVQLKFTHNNSPIAVTGLCISRIDASGAVNNYMNFDSEDGLVIGDYVPLLDSTKSLGPNIQLTVGKTAKVDGTNYANPQINLRYGSSEDTELVSIQAIDATTFNGYKIGSTGIIKDDTKWIKLTSQLSSSNDENININSIPVSGSPGIVLYSRDSSLSVTDESNQAITAEGRKKTGLLGMYILDKAAIKNKYKGVGNNVTNLGVITGNNFIIAGSDPNGGVSGNGAIAFQSDVQSLYNSSKGYTAGAVIYRGQHIYGKDSWVHGLWYYKAIVLKHSGTVGTGSNGRVCFTKKFSGDNGVGNYFPGAIREISFRNSNGNLLKHSFNLQGYTLNKVGTLSNGKDQYKLCVYAKNCTGKEIKNPRVRVEMLMFRDDHNPNLSS